MSDTFSRYKLDEFFAISEDTSDKERRRAFGHAMARINEEMYHRANAGPLVVAAPSDHHVEALWHTLQWPHPKARGPCKCGRPLFGSGSTCAICRECVAPKPPSLREWLGDRLSELGRWADVLREQPVPAGWIKRWEWVHDHLGWRLRGHTTIGDATPYESGAIAWCLDSGPSVNDLHGVQRDSLQMALFTRHPDVQPDPRPVQIVCEDQYEVMP